MQRSSNCRRCARSDSIRCNPATEASVLSDASSGRRKSRHPQLEQHCCCARQGRAVDYSATTLGIRCTTLHRDQARTKRMYLLLSEVLLLSSREHCRILLLIRSEEARWLTVRPTACCGASRSATWTSLTPASQAKDLSGCRSRRVLPWLIWRGLGSQARVSTTGRARLTRQTRVAPWSPHLCGYRVE